MQITVLLPDLELISPTAIALYFLRASVSPWWVLSSNPRLSAFIRG